jgi:hypothetical protein
MRAQNDGAICGKETLSHSAIIEASTVSFKCSDVKDAEHDCDAANSFERRVFERRVSRWTFRTGGREESRFENKNFVTSGGGAHVQKTIPPTVSVLPGGSKHCKETPDYAEGDLMCQGHPASKKKKRCTPDCVSPIDSEYLGQSKQKRSHESNHKNQRDDPVYDGGRKKTKRTNIGGASYCDHGRRKSECKQCGGASICEHGRRRSHCKQCGGASICEHGRQKPQCKQCGGASICEHGRIKSRCKQCGGASICQHGRRKSECKQCGGASLCKHGRQKSRCKQCRGASLCAHGRLKFACQDCQPHLAAATRFPPDTTSREPPTGALEIRGGAATP